MAERRFTRALSKPGSAAQVRETVSQAVRESTGLAKRLYVDPIDYEEFIQKNKTILQNDPQRELLLYPADDVSQATLPRRYRTVISSVPNLASEEVSSLFVQECIKTYTSSWSVVHYKYSGYSGNYLQLPKIPRPDHLEEQIYEVDAEVDHKDTESLHSSNGILKQGYLLKGPEATSFIAIATQSFKRRYVYLRQEVDGAHILEFHKDDKKGEPKGTICMEFCSEVIKNSKRGKMAFELKMKDSQKSYLLMAENELDMEDWIEKLNFVIQLSKQEDSNKRITIEYRDSPPPTPENRGTLKSLEHSRNPELMKYAKETDFSIAQARKENRQKLFAIYPEMGRVPSLPGQIDEPDSEPYREHFGTRFLVCCESLKFRLQAPVDSERGALSQVEPYITTLALYDAKRGKKISADFRFDVNHPSVRSMLCRSHKQNESVHTNGNGDCVSSVRALTVELGDISEEWLLHPKQAIFSVKHPDPEIYLVIKIEKVLQGAISQAVEPYLRNGDPKLGYKVHKIMRSCCQRLGQFRMPFAWAARPVFKPFTGEVDTYSEFHTIYKQESSKLSDEDLLKFLAELRKPDRISRLPTIPGSIKVSVIPIEKPVPNSLTSSLIPIRPFPVPPTHEPTFEVDEFSSGNAEDTQPYMSYVNHLYVCPKSLKYDTQKTFTKARNIACVIEFRDDDDTEISEPLKCIYGRPGEPLFVTQANCAVVHHSTCPDFYEEVKIALPAQLHNQHHLLFTFLHVSCEPPKGSKRKDQNIESVVGYSWIPILNKGRINVEEQTLSIASHLPSGYLSIEPLGLGKGFSGPDVRWVDNQKPLFRVDFKLISTIYTKDQHLHNFFVHMQRMLESRIPVSEGETCKNLKGETRFSTGSELGRELSKYIKAVHAVDVGTLISFFPTLLNQLFKLLISTKSDDVALNTVRLLVHIIHQVHEVGKVDILHTYLKYVFQTESMESCNGDLKSTVHEELSKSLTSMLQPDNTDFLVINKFLQNAWFFCQILIKSMAQHLLVTGRIKMQRTERFPQEYYTRIQTFLEILIPHIIQKYKELPLETRQANHSLACFIKKCLTFMDRGFVFRLVNLYISKFNPGDPKILQEYKFEFLQIVTSHEHYISLNLPLMRKGAGTGRGLPKNMKETDEAEEDIQHEYHLSEEFCRSHFLVGILLQEVRTALNELRDARRIAIHVLRNLLAKHSFDDRYQQKAQQARIVSLYLPFISIIMENLNRLDVPNPPPAVVNTPARVCNGSIVASETPISSPQLSAHRLTLTPDISRVYHENIRHQRDSSYLSMIAGQGILNLSQSVVNGESLLSLDSSSSSLSNESIEKCIESCDERDIESNTRKHNRSQSLPFSGQTVVRYDKLDEAEVKDLLVCFLYIIKNINEELLINWWHQCTESEILNFFQVLEICLHQFRYIGKKQISSRNQNLYGVHSKAMTLPARMGPPNFNNRTMSTYSETSSIVATSSDADTLYRALLEANMATEVGLIFLDIVGLYCVHFKEQLLVSNGDNALMHKIFDVHISFLEVGQSEKLLKHVFAALRAFINKFPVALFEGNATLCSRLCYEILKCCNSKLTATRNDACAILYLLMRSNFEFTNRKGLIRVHLQVIISVSQLLGEEKGLNNARFQESLSIVNNYANSDKAMQSTIFPSEVKDLTKRIRTVLMATTQMREHENDPEMLVDLQYSLANSYAATPELRKTWLETMARHHIKNGDLSEAAHCHLHIAALVAEYLKQKGLFKDGCNAFTRISPNIMRDESSLKEDIGIQDMQYTEDIFLELLEDCAESLEKAERYELMGEVYRIIIPIYEKRRDYEALTVCYKTLHNAYSKIVEVSKSCKRLLGTFYRVAFFGQPYFEEDAGKEFIYKEPKVTSLPEISERLYHLFCDKFGKEVVKMIMDSNQVDPKDLDPKYAYIQVSHVMPYFEEEELKHRITEFERNNNLQRFMFETPFTEEGKAHGSLEQQCKRKTILTTIYSFPYVKKRIAVFSKNVIELSPIEVAIEEMQVRVEELHQVVDIIPTDLKKLQLKLQGSVSVQVNAGPLAYASAFLDDKIMGKYPKDKVRDLKEVFRQFIKICHKALELNGKLIISDQYEYHEAMKNTFQELVCALAEILHEKLLHDSSSKRDSFTPFSLISLTPGSSTV